MKKSEVDRILGREADGESLRLPSASTSLYKGGNGVLPRVGATALEVLLGAPHKGTIKSLEGMYDATAGLVGAIGGIFNEDFKDNVGEHIAFDATDWLSKSIGYDRIEELSYLNDGKVGNFVRDAETAIGGMVPSIALSAIPYAGAVLGPVSMGLSSGGNAMEEALNKDAGYYNAWLYGIGRGAIESGVEMLGGFKLGKGGTLASKILANTKLGRFAQKPLGKAIGTVLSEAGEEIVTDLSDPPLLAATGVDTNIVENYKETIKGLPRTGALGGTIGLVMGGGSATVSGVRNSSRGGFKASRADNAMAYIADVSKNYGNDVNKNARYDKAINGALMDISRELTSMNESQRKEYLKTMGVFKNAFNSEDGSIKAELRANINEDAVSSHLRAISGTLAHSPISADTELSEGASKAKAYVEKMLGERASVVVTSDKAQNNAFYNKNEGIIYINNNAAFSGEEIAEFVAAHEVAHITEGTRAYVEMAILLDEIAKDPNAPAAIKAKIGDFKARRKQIREAYAEQMKNMNVAQKEYLVDTEYNADLVGLLLGDEYFIEKLANRNLPLVEKIFKGLKNLNKKSAAVDKASAKYLNKLVNKFGKAIDNAKGGVSIKSLGGTDEEKVEQGEVDEERKSVASSEKPTDETQITSQDVQIIRTINDGKRKSINDFTSEDIQKTEKWARKFYQELGIKSPFFRAWYGDWRAADKKSTKILEAALIEGKNPRGTFTNKDTGWEIVSSSIGYDETISHSGKDKLSVLAMRNVDRIIENGVLFDTETSEYGRGKKSIHTAFMHKFYSLIKIKEQFCIAKLAVEESYLPGQNKTHKKFYHVRAIKIEPVSSVEIGKSHTSIMENTDSNISISDLFKIVKQYDKDFNPKPVNSALLNEDGTPKVLYHGTNAEFYTFRNEKIQTSHLGEGFYFVDNKEIADSFASRRTEERGGKERVVEAYIKAEKVFDVGNITDEQMRDFLIYDYDARGRTRYSYRKKHGLGSPEAQEYAEEMMNDEDVILENGKKDYSVLFSVNEDNFQDWLKENNYDCLIVPGEDSKTGIEGNAYVIFDSKQIKSATDNIGTFDKDNPDIRYSKSKNIDFTDEKRYNKVERKSMDSTVVFTNTDYETLRSEVMRKNSSGKGIYPMDYAYTANHIVIYNNHGEADFTIIAIYDIDSYEKNNIAVKEKIDEIDESRRSVRDDIIRYRNRARRDSRFANDAGYGGTNDEDGGLYRRDYRGERNTEIQSTFGESSSNNKRIKKTKLKEAHFDDDGNVIDEVRYSKSKSERFMPARHTKMAMAEDLVKHLNGKIQLKDNEISTKLGVLGYENITAENAAEELSRLDAEIREYATSERAAYRESNKKDTSSVAKATPSPQGKGYKGAEDEENFRNLVENDPNEIKHRAAERERKESEESLLNEGGKVRETTTEFDEPEMSNEERRLMASAERMASGKDFFPRHAEMRPSNDESWDYWLGEVDRREGSVRKLKNGKVKVGMAQTANEVKLTKFINNKIMDKAYSNENVKSVIDKILSNSDIWGADESGAYIAKLKGKDLINAKKRLWAALNTAPEGERIGPALDIADFIVTHGMIEETVEITEDVINAQYIIDTLEPYKRKIDISHIKGDIEAVFDTDRSPFGLWAQKKSDTSRPFTADEVGQALEDAGIMLGGERGKLINEADIFIAMHKLYTEAQAIIKAATPTKNDIIGAYDAKEVHEIKQKIAREILRSYDEYGKETSFARLEKKFRGEIASLKKRVSEVYELNRAKNEMLYQAGRLQDKKKGKFHNATQAQNEALNGIISVLSKLKYRSDINKSSSRALLDELAKWYTEENPLLQGGAVDKKTSESKGFYSPYIKELIDYFRIDEDGAVNNKPLKIDEIYAINKILAHMNFVVENFGKIWRGGKWVEAKDVGTKQLDIFNSAVQNQTVITRLIGNKFTDFFMDPEVIFSRLDGGDREGFFLSALWDMREADIKQRYLEMLALRELDEFEKNNKKYIKDFMSDKTTLTVGAKIDLRAEGVPTAEPLKIPKYAAVDLYLVSKTGNAIDTFEETGWFLKLDGKKSEKQQATITREHIKELEKQFTEKDWELIKILEKQYNGNLRQLKFETDMIRLGMSNVFDGYYYPINRRGASDLDSNDFFFMMERVGNSPFNNSRARGAKNAIIVSNALTKFKRHVNGVTRYASYAVPIENINKILNVDVGNNANMPTSMQTALKTNDFARGAEDYLKKLIADAQQVNIKSDDATKFVSQLRGRYAKYQLGLNPKVIFTQASSYIAGFGELRASSLAWAVAHLPKLTNKAFDAELDKYCPWAAVRHYEKGATRAMTVTDKVDKVGDFFTQGIEFTDRQIVKLEFLACQKEAQARFGLKIGTEENKIKAGELLTELGLKTQQNQLTTEKSAAMRSESEFAKTLTMFKADSMKQVSRWLQAVSTASVLRRKMQAAKQAGDMATYNALEAEYKKSVKTICKYSSVIVVSSIYMVMLARLFNKFYGRDEEDDENKILGFFKDIFGNICGMIPVISELYSFFFEGYDTGSFMYDSINNVLSASKGVVDTCVSLVGGENVSKEKINSSIRDVIYALGISTGIPTKNAYKVTKGILDLVAPNAGDKVDAWFKVPSEKGTVENIKAAIDKGDARAQKTQLDLLYGKYDLELKDAVLRGEYDRLMTIELTKGEDDKVKYTPLEAKIPSNLEIDGEDVELTRKDVNAFKNALISCESAQARVVKTANYKRLGNEERAYALRKINQYYFESTKYNYTGEKSSFAYYAKLVGVEQLALIMAYAKNLKGDEADSRFKKAQTRREKIEAYIKALGLNSVKTSLALRALGYGDKENDALVTSYVGRASALTKEERAEMLEILG